MSDDDMATSESQVIGTLQRGRDGGFLSSVQRVPRRSLFFQHAELTPPPSTPTSAQATIDSTNHRFIQVFALVGEGIAGATHALLSGDREVAKRLVDQDELVDQLTKEIAREVLDALACGIGTVDERHILLATLRMLPDLERNGDLAEHIARRAVRGLGAEMSPRSRGLVERMGEVATTIWRATGDLLADGIGTPNSIEDLDDELDDLHVTLTAEVGSGSMALPVAIELAMVARFYERFGDHAVNLARRMANPPAAHRSAGAD